MLSTHEKSCCSYERITQVQETARTMRRDDLSRLGWDSNVPRGQRAIGVAADKLFPLVVPSHRVDRLRVTATQC